MSTLFNLTDATPKKANIVKGIVNDRKCIDGFILRKMIACIYSIEDTTTIVGTMN